MAYVDDLSKANEVYLKLLLFNPLSTKVKKEKSI